MSFTRWGRITCPSTQGTQLVYEGTVVGSRYNQAGSSEYLCLHNKPEFHPTNPGHQHYRAKLYGTEYSFISAPSGVQKLHNHDVPCAVCYTASRSTKITIPGRITCPNTWIKEYNGYLMTATIFPDHRSRVPICVDLNAEAIAGSSSQRDTSWLYLVETACDGIKCPPYSDGAELACVVCTK